MRTWCCFPLNHFLFSPADICYRNHLKVEILKWRTLGTLASNLSAWIPLKSSQITWTSIDKAGGWDWKYHKQTWCRKPGRVFFSASGSILTSSAHSAELFPALVCFFLSGRFLWTYWRITIDQRKPFPYWSKKWKNWGHGITGMDAWVPLCACHRESPS